MTTSQQFISLSPLSVNTGISTHHDESVPLCSGNVKTVAMVSSSSSYHIMGIYITIWALVMMIHPHRTLNMISKMPSNSHISCASE